jgi:hypothetical protein
LRQHAPLAPVVVHVELESGGRQTRGAADVLAQSLFWVHASPYSTQPPPGTQPEVGTHPPAEQVSPAPQTLPHSPQLFESVWKSGAIASPCALCSRTAFSLTSM